MGYPGPRRRTGPKSRAGTIRPGWILTLARQMRGAGMKRTGLRTRTGDLLRQAGTRRAGLGRRTGGLVCGARTVFTRRLQRTSGRVWRADSGEIKSRTCSVGRMSCLMHQHSNSLITLQSPHPLLHCLCFASFAHLQFHHDWLWFHPWLRRPSRVPPPKRFLGLPLLAKLLGPLVVGSSVTIIFL